MAGLIAEPGYLSAAFVDEVATRYGETFRAMVPELAKVLDGMILQIAMLKADQHFDLRSLSFENVRWTRDGQLVMDVLHDRRRFYPKDVRPWA